MKTQDQQTIYSKDAANKQIIVTREFAAPLQQVWSAWTQSDLLNQWWAPKPWKAGTKSMDFKEGGHWLYSMADPEGMKHWACLDYKTIVPQHYFIAQNRFCDENGNSNPDMPTMNWKCTFQSSAVGTKVVIEISFAKETDMAKVMEMGFEAGFAMAHENLDVILAQ